MGAKEFLKEIAIIDAQINGIVADMQRWYDRATSITAQPKTIVSFENGEIKKTIAPPSFGDGISDKVGDSVAEYVDIEMESDVKELIQRRQDILNMLRKIKNPDQFNVLWKYYVLHMSNQEIADDMDKSLTWVSTVKSDALKKLSENLNVF